MGEKVEVFGAWFSPFSLRVELALKLKGIQYDYIEEQIYKKKSDLILKYNPVYKKVPTFVHAGKPIAESIVILQYIDETWKENPLLPHDPYQKALALFWAKFMDDKVVDIIWVSIFVDSQLLQALIKSRRRQGKEKEEAVAEAGEALRALEEELKGKKFFGGETLGFVDIVANFIAYWTPAMEEALGEEVLTSQLQQLPRLRQWCHDFLEHSVVKQTLSPKTELLEFMSTQFGTEPT
ncbi:putative glutathione S-transferase, partial [Cucurbita argyrosperma subsp. argyrosperma]